MSDELLAHAEVTLALPLLIAAGLFDAEFAEERSAADGRNQTAAIALLKIGTDRSTKSGLW